MKEPWTLETRVFRPPPDRGRPRTPDPDPDPDGPWCVDTTRLHSPTLRLTAPRPDDGQQRRGGNASDGQHSDEEGAHLLDSSDEEAGAEEGAHP